MNVKKIIIITLCLIAVGFIPYLVVPKASDNIFNNPNKVDNQSSETSGSNKSEYINKDGSKDVASFNDVETVENAKDNSADSANKVEEKGNKKEEELSEKSLENKQENVAEAENGNSSQNDDEFYDTSDRDPFAEEQHKSNVPLVLVDKDGNEREPETVYWDESGRGTLDSDGYIPDNLPPGAVYVCEVDDDELARIKEEFGVGD